MDDRPGRWYSIPAQDRDRIIVALRRRGWTYAKVGMSESGGVGRSLPQTTVRHGLANSQTERNGRASWVLMENR